MTRFNLDLPTPSSQSSGSEVEKDAALQAALVYAESIVATIREPLIVLDTRLRVKTANRAFYQTFQVLPQDTEGELLENLGDGQWKIPQLLQLLGEVLTQDAVFDDFEVEHNFQQLGHKTMLLNARRILVQGSQPEMILLAIDDITARKQTEDALKLFTIRLERSNRELQDFASVASHDLQEPLRKIQAFGDLLQQECGSLLPETGQHYLRRMQSAASRMQTLINDLLAFSRITTKAQPYVRVNLQSVLQEVLADLEVHLQQTQAQVEVGSLPEIDADPLQMRQLLQNLISNALKFHQPDRPPQIRIEARQLPPAIPDQPQSHSPRCQILVQDQGIGFDEKYLDRIFTVFQRLHYRNEYEGTGVGLAICRKIAERHGGEITATSQPGVGSTFIVTLPMQQLPSTIPSV